LLLGSVTKAKAFAITPGHELMATRLKPEFAVDVLGISPDDVLDLSGPLVDVCPKLACGLLQVFERH
jgi:hypothetical protein